MDFSLFPSSISAYIMKWKIADKREAESGWGRDERKKKKRSKSS
jgi:hypothetical protein